VRRALICFLVVTTAVMTSVAFSTSAAVAAVGDIWDIRNTPQSSWRAVAHNGGSTYVAVADGGADRVMTSTDDGATWTYRNAPTNPWTSIAYGNGTFVAVANGGSDRVMYSTDNGATWTPRTVEASAWSSVTFGNNTFVAVATSGSNKVMTSPDGINWTAVTDAVAGADGWSSVVYGANDTKFVAVGANGKTMYSTAGASWTAGTNAPANNWTSVAYDGNTFVAVSSNGTDRAMTSGNGQSWAPSGDTETANGGWTSVVWDAGDTRFVAVGSGTNRAMTSANGSDWDLRSAPANTWTAVTTDGADLVAVASAGDNRVMTSPEGQTWTGVAVVTGQWTGVTSGEGLFVAVGSGPTINRIMTSPNGTDWTGRPAPEANAWAGVTYGGGKFVAVATTGSNRVMTSDDGITWAPHGAAAGNPWTAVTYGKGKFVAVSSSGSDRVMTSPDGITWTLSGDTDGTDDGAWTSVTYAAGIGGGTFVAVAGSGGNQVMTSTDGTDWTPRDAAFSADWRSVTSDGSTKFVAVSYDQVDRSMSSPTGVTWTAGGDTDDTDNANWTSVTYGAATYVAVSGTGGTVRVITSTNGSSWDSKTSNNAQLGSWSSVTYRSGLFVAVATGGSGRIMTSGTYVPSVPTITSFTPTSGAVGSTVTINGTNFVSPALITFNGTPAPSYTVVGPTQITVTVPEGATTGPIEVTTDGGAVTSANNFSVVAGAVRIWGQDELDTSIAISQAEFPGDNTASAVVLARNDFFPDALAGGPLAAQESGPLLLTYGAPTPKGGTLPAKVLNEIDRVLEEGDTVYLLGGDLAISPAVATALESAGYTVVRLWGANQFGTAVAIANEITDPANILEATGWNFPDALSAVPAAIKIDGVILLTNNNKQAPETQAFIDAHPSLTRYTIGGNLVAGGADPGATNISGQNLYDTSAAVADRWFPAPNEFGVATGNNFPDALSGGVFMATGGRMGPMLLVNGTTLPVPPSIDSYLGTLNPGTTGYAFGGVIAITDAVLGAVMASVG